MKQNNSPNPSPPPFIIVSQKKGKFDVTLPWLQNFWIKTLGSLSNDDGDGNETGKKVIIGLY